MTDEQRKDVEGYIERSIPDIARKCGVKCDEVEQQWLNVVMRRFVKTKRD